MYCMRIMFLYLSGQAWACLSYFDGEKGRMASLRENKNLYREWRGFAIWKREWWQQNNQQKGSGWGRKQRIFPRSIFKKRKFNQKDYGACTDFFVSCPGGQHLFFWPAQPAADSGGGSGLYAVGVALAGSQKGADYGAWLKCGCHGSVACIESSGFYTSLGSVCGQCVCHYICETVFRRHRQ